MIASQEVDAQVSEALAALGERIKATRRKRGALGLPTCADELPALRKLSALMEEVGEVAEAIQDYEGRERLRSELLDVATCAVMWAATVTDADATQR